MEPPQPKPDWLAIATRYAPLFRLGCLWGTLVIAAVLLRGVFDEGGRSADFKLFYETLERVRGGLPMYGSLVTHGRAWMSGPNFNPPHFYLLVAPFAALPFPAAFVMWTVAGLGAGFVLAAQTTRALGVKLLPAVLLMVAGLVLANAALASTLRGGQLSLLLALPVGLAWLAGRQGRWMPAGAWLGLAASVKPFLLVFAPYLVCKREWGGALAMAAAGGACLVLGAIAFGADAFHGWLQTFESPRMDPHFYNGSFAGFVARALGSAFKSAGHAVAALALVLTLLAALRSTDADLAWLLLLTGSLLWSPLGWIYYGWILMPPVVALGVRGRLPRLAWAWVLLWLWPAYTLRLAGGDPVLASTLGSVYFWGLLLMWTGLITSALAESSRMPRPALRPVPKS